MILPAAETVVPAAMLVAAEINPPVKMLPPVMLPTAEAKPAVCKLPPTTVLLTEIAVPVTLCVCKLPLVTLPVVDIVFDPNAASNVVTLALPYVAGNPVSCDPLPRK